MSSLAKADDDADAFDLILEILDADTYRNAYDKIENAIFVRESAQS